MKNSLNWILSLLFLLSGGILSAQEGPTVTIYNRNLGLVQETRELQLEKGEQEISLTDIAAKIQPSSVHFTPEGRRSFQILEQNYQYDLVSTSKVFEKYLGEKIRIITKGEERISGELLSRDGSTIMIRNQDGSLRLLDTGNIVEYNLPELPQGLILRPTLQWIVSAGQRGSTVGELSYLTDGMSWEAEYILLLSRDDEGGTLSSWVTLENNSGATFRDARVKLVAGDIHRAKDEREGPRVEEMMVQTMARRSGVEEREIFEYHLYEIRFPTTLYQNSMKQVTLREPTEIQYDREYTFEHRERESVQQENVDVQIAFRNSEKNNLGMPLPSGVVRLMQRDEDGGEILIGEDRIGHTPKDEEIRLTAGRAFDVVGDRQVAEYNRRGERTEEMTLEISLRNHKDEAVTVKVLERFYGDWEVLRESHKSTRPDAATLQFDADIPASGETTIKYTILRQR